MSYALQHAVDEYREDLQRYGIEVNVSARCIIYENKVVRYDPYTQNRIYRRDLRRLIARAKDKEKQAIKDKQVTLL